MGWSVGQVGWRVEYGWVGWNAVATAQTSDPALRVTVAFNDAAHTVLSRSDSSNSVEWQPFTGSKSADLVSVAISPAPERTDEAAPATLATGTLFVGTFFSRIGTTASPTAIRYENILYLYSRTSVGAAWTIEKQARYENGFSPPAPGVVGVTRRSTADFAYSIGSGPIDTSVLTNPLKRLDIAARPVGYAGEVYDSMRVHHLWVDRVA